MKQAKLKSILILLALILIGAVVTFATLTGVHNAPENGVYSMAINQAPNCTFTESEQHLNITNASINTDFSGSWAESYSRTSTTGLGNPYTFAAIINISTNNASRGDYNWYCEVTTDGIVLINESYAFPALVSRSFNSTSLKLSYTPIKSISIVNHSSPSVPFDTSMFTIDYSTGNITFKLSDQNMTTWNNSMINVTYYLNGTGPKTYAMANRTIYYRPAPVVTTGYPPNNFKNKTIDYVNFSVTGTANQYYCTLYSNETGSYVPSSYTMTVTNADINKTNVTLNHGFPEKSGINYGIFCSETSTIYSTSAYIWAYSSNKTVTVDATNPVIVNYFPVNNSYSKSTEVTVGINLTDLNLQSCRVFVNNLLNLTNNSMNVGYAWLYIPNNLSTDGNFSIAFECNDTAANSILLNYTNVIVDTIAPVLRYAKNISTTGYCDRFNMTWNVTETSNGSIRYGKTVTLGDEVSSPYSSTDHNAVLTFNNSKETTYYVNFTSCDLATNCNTTNVTIVSPTKLCTGWSEFAYLSDSVFNLSDVLTQSNADFIYYWNATNQQWVSYAGTGAGNGAYNLRFGNVYLLYTSTNETFWRNYAGTGTGAQSYNYNFTTGNNFVGITKQFNFVNLTVSLNASQFLGNFANFTYFSGWNNSAKRTVDYRFNKSWNNGTLLGRTFDIESVWIWSMKNVTWNTTNITGSW